MCVCVRDSTVPYCLSAVSQFLVFSAVLGNEATAVLNIKLHRLTI